MAGSGTSQAAGGLPPPLAVLYERAGLPAWPLPRVLAEVYGGDLGFRQPCVYANFVASVDGVTALGPEYPSSGSAISLHDPADRFVMGLLRACADVVLIGAGTLRATPGHRWTPAYVCPAAADGYDALRRTRGLPIDALLAVVTARGDIPAGHPARRRAHPHHGGRSPSPARPAAAPVHHPRPRRPAGAVARRRARRRPRQGRQHGAH